MTLKAKKEPSCLLRKDEFIDILQDDFIYATTALIRKTSHCGQEFDENKSLMRIRF